jgi:glutathione peroxidase-family protein
MSIGGIYSLYFNTPDGNAIALSSFAGHKILIVVFNPSTADYSQLKRLDSVQTDSPSVKILAIPGTELAKGYSDSVTMIQDSSLTSMRSRLGLSLLIARAMYVNKADSSIQHPLFNWLTHVGQNTHFDRDVDSEGQLFFINENGVLYGVLPKNTSKEKIEQVLNTHIIQ